MCSEPVCLRPGSLCFWPESAAAVPALEQSVREAALLGWRWRSFRCTGEVHACAGQADGRQYARDTVWRLRFLTLCLFGAKALPPLPPPEHPNSSEAALLGPAVAVQPHALEEHVPALAGPATVSTLGDAAGEGAAEGLLNSSIVSLDGPGCTRSGGPSTAGGGRDCAVALTALWCATVPCVL